jgi:hypothetical protein
MKPLAGGFSVFRQGKGDLAMIVACIAVFFITFGVLMARRSEPFLPQVNGAPRVAAPPETAEQLRDSVRPRQPDPSPPDRVRTVEQAASPAARIGMAATAANPSGGELPVDVNFRRGRAADSPLEGSIFNKSGDDLQVEVDFYKPETKRTSKVELTVPANHAMAFGRDDGLEIGGGDEVTIKSPPYAEVHLQVR